MGPDEGQCLNMQSLRRPSLSCRTSLPVNGERDANREQP